MNDYRNRTFLLLFVAFASAATLLLTACASTPDRIVGAPVAAATATSSASLEIVPPSITVGPVLATDLVSAAYNLDQAVAVGALPANDPAPACVHDVLRQAGLEGAASGERQSFTPKRDGIVSAGTILYVLAAQAKAAATQQVTVSAACLQIIGQIQVDVLKLTARAGMAALPSVVSGGMVGDLKAIGSGVRMLQALPKP